MKLCLAYTILLGLSLTIGYRAGEAKPLTPQDTTALDTLVDTPTPTEEEIDIPPSASPALLADRLSCIEKTIPLSYNSRVMAFVDYFTIKHRDYSRMVMGRIDLYFPLFEKYLKRYNLPDELKYLAIVESGLNPKAVSRAGAVGLWQFMPSTGRAFGLSNGWYIDDRRDPEKSTKAACRYLAQLYAMFKDWELVLVAYNSGPGKVRSAIRKAGYRKKINAIHKYLPRETRSYLSQFVAINYTLNYSTDHNLSVSEKELPIPYDTLAVNDFLHVETFANLTRTDVDSLYLLNPSVLRSTIPDKAKPYILKVPVQAKEILNENRAFILDSASKVGKKEIAKYLNKVPKNALGRTKRSYRVRSGDVLGTIARRFRVRVKDIQHWNRLHSTLIRVGQRLTLWVPPSATPQNRKSQPKPSSPSSSYAKVYTVIPGDTLWDISRKFAGLSIQKLKSLNDLQSNRLYPGQKLILK